MATVGLSQIEAEAQRAPLPRGKRIHFAITESRWSSVRDGRLCKTRGRQVHAREILGGSVAGPDAATLIHEVVVAMRFRATADSSPAIPHYHPTLSEMMALTLREQLAESLRSPPVMLPGGHKAVSSLPRGEGLTDREERIELERLPMNLNNLTGNNGPDNGTPSSKHLLGSDIDIKGTTQI